MAAAVVVDFNDCLRLPPGSLCRLRGTVAVAPDGDGEVIVLVSESPAHDDGACAAMYLALPEDHVATVSSWRCAQCVGVFSRLQDDSLVVEARAVRGADPTLENTPEDDAPQRCRVLGALEQISFVTSAEADDYRFWVRAQMIRARLCGL